MASTAPLTPEVVAVCAELLKLVSIVRMGLEPNDDDLESAVTAAKFALHPSQQLS